MHNKLRSSEFLLCLRKCKQNKVAFHDALIKLKLKWQRMKFKIQELIKRLVRQKIFDHL